MSKLKRFKKKAKREKSFKERILKNHIVVRLSSLISNISQDGISAYSSEAALFTIISFFPFLMLFFFILSYTSLTPAFIIRLINDSFPSEIINLIMTVVDQLNNTSKTVLSLIILSALWSSSRGFLAIVKGLDVIYKSEHKTNIIVHRIYALLYTLGFALLLTITLGLLGFGNKIYIALITHFPVVKDLALLVMGMRATVLLAILLFFFLVMYIVLPNRKTSLIYELPGAILSSLGWIGFSYGFSFYIDNMANFSYVYGSLTAIVLLLLWVYFCMYILFIGAEVNFFLYNYIREKVDKKDPNSKILKIRGFIKKITIKPLLSKKRNNKKSDEL